MTVIRPASRFGSIDLPAIWEFRGLLVRFASRDLRLRYKQTALGAVWVILQPLLSAGIFSFVFGKVAGLSSNGVNYFAFAFAGMLLWGVFSQTISKVSSSLVGNAALISKVYFPRLILPLSSFGSTSVDFLIGLVSGLIIAFASGAGPGWPLLTLPVWFALAAIWGLALGLFASAWMVEYRDVGYVLPVLLQLLLYTSPVAYAVSAVPDSARAFVHANPLTVMLEGGRWSLLSGTSTPSTPAALLSFGIALALLLGGAAFFSTKERRFADVA